MRTDEINLFLAIGWHTKSIPVLSIYGQEFTPYFEKSLEFSAVFQNVYFFYPLFLEETLTMSCGIPVVKSWSRY